MSEMERKVKALIAEHLSIDVDSITPTARFVEDLGADSLDSVELVMALEEAFGVNIPDDVASGIGTLEQMLSYLESAVQDA